MSSYNKAIICGNVSSDVESRALPSGSTFAGFSVATNEKYKTKDGQQQEKADFHSVEVYAGLADTCAKYVQKGMKVLVEGRIENKSWEKDGVKHYKTIIKADKVLFLSQGKGAGQQKDDFDQRGQFGDEPNFNF